MLEIYLSIFFVKIMNGTFNKTGELTLIRDMGLLMDYILSQQCN